MRDAFKTILVLCFTLLLAKGSAAQSMLAKVSFETLPNSTDAPVDDQPLPIDATYTLANNVTLSFAFFDAAGATFPGEFEAVGGGDQEAKLGFRAMYGLGSGANDRGRTASFNDLLGQFFLRSPDTVSASGPRANLRIQYGNNQNMRYAAGEIWDIDAGSQGNEKWEITAYNSANQFLTGVVSPIGINQNISPSVNPNQLDSAPWVFEIFAGDDIASIEIKFAGTKDDGVGLAFNNFTTAITLPADFNEDLAVDGVDLQMWRGGFGAASGAGRANGDADANGTVDGSDFLTWQQQFGRNLSSPASTVPEPSAGWLVLVGLFVVQAVCRVQS